LAGTAFKDARVVAKSKSFEPVLVNIETEPELAGQYNVSSTPTIVYVAPGGKALAVTIDAVEPDEALADMDAALAALARPAEDAK
jgi:thioredoxin-like negative regulator of GroEL